MASGKYNGAFTGAQIDEAIGKVLNVTPMNAEIYDPQGKATDIFEYVDERSASAKTAYQAAQDGGYAGTEEEFNTALAGINELATQSEVDELKTSVSEGKSLIAAAVTDKGVKTAADATFQTMAENIAIIPSGSSYAGTKAHSKTFEAIMGWTAAKGTFYALKH